MEQLSRRQMVQGLAAVAGATGMSTVSAVASGVVAVGALALTVHLEGLRVAGENLAMAPGRQALLSASVLAHDGGEEIGRLHALLTALAASGRVVDPSGPATLDLHTFTLPEGVITGQGVTAHDGTGTYAVTGGTGRYHGARGSYAGARRLEPHRSGAADYRFELILPEVSRRGR